MNRNWIWDRVLHMIVSLETREQDRRLRQLNLKRNRKIKYSISSRSLSILNSWEWSKLRKYSKAYIHCLRDFSEFLCQTAKLLMKSNLIHFHQRGSVAAILSQPSLMSSYLISSKFSVGGTYRPRREDEMIFFMSSFDRPSALWLASWIVPWHAA